MPPDRENDMSRQHELTQEDRSKLGAPARDEAMRDSRTEASYWLSRELSLFGDVMEQGGAAALVWTSADALVVSRRDTRLLYFKQSVAKMEREYSTPVFVRESGGTAVRVGPGVVNVALVYCHPRGCMEAFDVGYGELLRLVTYGLSDLGLCLELGAVDGAYCDGAHNLVSRGLKIAGTAQRRSARKFGATLVHGSLLVSVDLPSMIAQLNDFYTTAGAPTQYLASACTTVERELNLVASSDAGTNNLVGAVQSRIQACAKRWTMIRKFDQDCA